MLSESLSQKVKSPNVFHAVAELLVYIIKMSAIANIRDFISLCGLDWLLMCIIIAELSCTAVRSAKCSVQNTEKSL